MMSSRADVLMAGEVLTPGQDGYDEAAVTVFAAGAPDLVVRPRDASGVAIALRYAVGAGLPVSVRSGGHSPAGYSTSDGGVVIDLRHLREVRVLDPVTRQVRVGAGATWGAVAAALQRTGLAVTSGDTASVGVGGLTLAGGIGWMVRRYGLAVDAVTGAEMVSADGQLVRANATEHPGPAVGIARRGRQLRRRGQPRLHRPAGRVRALRPDRLPARRPDRRSREERGGRPAGRPGAADFRLA
jgi:FAD/FMN-containing dehydrogenase